MSSESNFKFIGQRAPKVAGVGMVTGKAVYAADVDLPGMLHAKILRSPYAHARIRGIDTSKALALPGVKAVITGQNMPLVADEAPPPTAAEIAEKLIDLVNLSMARDEVLFCGHPVAAVAAVDRWTAAEAVRLIEVDYEELSAVIDVEEAMRPDAPVVHASMRTRDMLHVPIGETPTNVAVKVELGRGDAEAGLREADVVIEARYVVEEAHHGHIEPQACVAAVDPDGRVTVWASTQGIFMVQRAIADIFGLPLNKVKVMPMELGGGFGGKLTVLVEQVTVLLALRTGLPVKLVLSREEVIRAMGPAAKGVVKVRSGCRRDGSITAIDYWGAFDAGCLPGAPVIMAPVAALNLYGKVANVRAESYDVVTNKPHVTPYRAPGGPEGNFAVEQNIDAMAKAIGMDPVLFRLHNCSEEGDPKAQGRPFGPIGIREILERMYNHPHYQSPLQGPNQGRGVALGFWAGGSSASSVSLKLEPDGSVTLQTGMVDMTGTRTAIQQICAEELGLESIEQVRIIYGDTEANQYNDVTAASRTTYSMSVTVHKACQDVLARMRELAAARFRVDVGEIDSADGRFWVRDNPERVATMKQLTPREGLTVGASVTQRRFHPECSGGIADVEVDPETGKVAVLRYTAFQDVGRAINPTRVEAQMQGGVAQGVGWALMEEIIHNKKGAIRNASLLDYRMLVARDLPMIATEIIEVPTGEEPFGVRGAGEVAIVAPASVIANAVQAAAGVRTYHMPMTPERLFWAMNSARAENDAAPVESSAPAVRT